MSSNFYGGILQKIIKRYSEYPLTAEILTSFFEDYPELKSGDGSAVDNNDFLLNFLQNLNPKPVDVIEIGTFMGLSSAILASVSRTVFTFDIWYRNSHPLWVVLALDDRINCYTGNQKFIDDVIRAIKYNPELDLNLAFIDGMHKVKNVIHDFKQVEFTGRVLFHDVNIPEIGEFVLNIGGKILSNEDPLPIGTFGYWEKEIK